MSMPLLVQGMSQVGKVVWSARPSCHIPEHAFLRFSLVTHNAGRPLGMPPSPPLDETMEPVRTDKKEYAPLSLPPAEYQNLHLSYKAEVGDTNTLLNCMG